MINREDMLELTRRMTPARSSISRLAGAYYDEEGYVDGTFNTHFLKLSQAERTKNLELAKTVLISKTNEELKDYQIPQTSRKPGSIWQLLDGMIESELKNEGSEEVYTYLLCSISPLEGEYEPGKPEFGFLYPAFRDRTGDDGYINIFEAQSGKYQEVIHWISDSDGSNI